MKRIGDLFEKIVSVENILLAHKNAKKGKAHYKDVKRFDSRPYHYARRIRNLLISGEYKPSAYIKMTVCDRGKPRDILKTGYFPDRIIHHAIMQVVQPILESVYIKDTYQSIKGRGSHKALERINGWMKDEKATRYCLKMDIRKFYPSIDNETPKALLRKKIKCQKTLILLDTLVDSTDGLPIGNYTSQTLANYYLAFFDHFVKEQLASKYYVRYADDIVIFSESKDELNSKFLKIKEYLSGLKLEIKGNWQVFEVRGRGLDFLGYRMFGGYTLLRKSVATKIKRAFKLPIVSMNDINRLMSYMGWMKWADSYNLLRRLLSGNIASKVAYVCAKAKKRNPLRNLFIVPKQRKHNIQLTLF